MQLYKMPLKNVMQTGDQMRRLAIDYCKDLLPFKNFSLPQFFAYVKDLQYIPDPPEIEHISRPAAALSKTASFRDCDEKSILIAAFLTMQKMGKAWRFVATSSNKEQKLHHVLVEWDCGTEKIFLDATYSRNKLFMFKRFTRTQPICDWVKV